MKKQQPNKAEIIMEEGDIDALYLRLSRDDEQEGESNSIANQRALLMAYAKKNHLKNIRVFVDDGVSGATLKRGGIEELIALVEADKVRTVIVKDMSRLGRNYIEMGQLTEIVFPQHNVRLIAVNDNVDSAMGEDDFTPFRNIMKNIRCLRRDAHSALSAPTNRQGAPLHYLRMTADEQIFQCYCANLLHDLF